MAHSGVLIFGRQRSRCGMEYSRLLKIHFCVVSEIFAQLSSLVSQQLFCVGHLGVSPCAHTAQDQGLEKGLDKDSSLNTFFKVVYARYRYSANVRRTIYGGL